MVSPPGVGIADIDREEFQKAHPGMLGAGKEYRDWQMEPLFQRRQFLATSLP
jgi:hypothetical protein